MYLAKELFTGKYWITGKLSGASQLGSTIEEAIKKYQIKSFAFSEGGKAQYCIWNNTLWIYNDDTNTFSKDSVILVEFPDHWTYKQLIEAYPELSI